MKPLRHTPTDLFVTMMMVGIGVSMTLLQWPSFVARQMERRTLH
jgi:hypothetical protein